MNGEAAPEQEARDRAARDLRRQAVSLSRSEFEMNRVRHAMNQIEPAKVKALGDRRYPVTRNDRRAGST
jgi:hypothetical protein